MTLCSLFQSLRKGNALRSVDVMRVSECFETVIQTPYYPISGLKLRHNAEPLSAAGARVAGSPQRADRNNFLWYLHKAINQSLFLKAYHHSNL